MKIKSIFLNGLIKENPILVMMLGMCPSLGVTSSAKNGLGMGLATVGVLILSNIMISAMKNIIPDKVRIPCYIVIIATFVTMVDLLMAAYLPAIHAQLGIFIPLIVVNCIVLGRAEMFAAKNSVWSSFWDGGGMGLGFTLALVLIGSCRELLGAGTVFSWAPFGKLNNTFLLFILPPGAFICLAYLIAFINRIKRQVS